MKLKATVEIEAGAKTFASGVLLELLSAMRATHSGDLISLTTTFPAVAADLEAWSRLTGNTIVGMTEENGSRLVSLGFSPLPQRRVNFGTHTL